MTSRNLIITCLFLNAFFKFYPIITRFSISIWSVRLLSQIIIFSILYLNIYYGRFWAKSLYLVLATYNIIYFIALFPLQLNSLHLNSNTFFYFGNTFIQSITLYLLLAHPGIKYFLKLQSKK